MIIKNIPKKYSKIWKESMPYLKKGRLGDLAHAAEAVNLILNYEGKIKFDIDVLIPVAIMHDIGHSAILPQHFKYITGPEKIRNGKLAHMLVGAKIANDILNRIKYNPVKSREIIEIISIHDFNQLKDISVKNIYNTTNKKFFHDIDSMDRYTEKRLKSFSQMYPREKFIEAVSALLDQFFYLEFKRIAAHKLEALKKNETARHQTKNKHINQSSK